MPFMYIIVSQCNIKHALNIINTPLKYTKINKINVLNDSNVFLSVKYKLALNGQTNKLDSGKFNTTEL